MMHKEYIDMIINSTDDNKMHQLKDVLVNTISYISTVDPKIYKQIEDDLYEIVEGKKLNKEKAIQWVNSMVPRGKWSFAEAERIKNTHQTDLPLIAIYIIMNMLYSDSSDVIGEEINEETINKYIKAAEDWYYDEDATHTEDEKLYYYKKYIVG